MGRNRIFYITKALMLSTCMMIGTLLTTGITTAYAASDGNQEAGNPDESGNNQTDSEEESELIDYALEVSTEEEDFGTIIRGDEVDPIEFTVTNVGETEITLAYKAEDGDEYAFAIEPVTDGKPTSSEGEGDLIASSENIELYDGPMFLEPGEEIVFRVSVEDGLEPGNYSVTYEFYPEESTDHDDKKAVTFYVTVKEPEPYITGVEVSPSKASVLVGKSHKFKAAVYGEYDYDETVFWEVAGNTSSATKITSDGTLTVGNDENSSSLIVIATSRQDPSFYEKSNVNVQFIEHAIQLSTEPSDGGTVSGGGTVRNGGSTRATATANDYYTFSGWYEGSSLVSTSSQIQISNVTYDRSFTAVFKKARYTVSATVSPSGAGKVENTGTYDAGEEVALRAVPNEGYDFIGWILNSQNVSGDLEYVYGPLEKNISLTASFKAKEARTFRIESGTANQGGKISPNGDNFVQEGKSATYKMVPDSGYRVHAVAVDGVNIGAVDSYTFNDVYEEHSIAVSFEVIPKEAVTRSDSRGNNTDSEEEYFEDEELQKTPEELEAEMEETANEAEDEQTSPGLIDRINKGEVTEETPLEKTQEEDKVISSRELYDRTYTLEDEAAPLAASAEPLTSAKPTMAQKSNFVLRIVVAVLMAIVFTSVGYTYFWLFQKKPSDDDSE